jgi:hypothetical protein
VYEQLVIAVQAGIQSWRSDGWMPAFAGMTGGSLPACHRRDFGSLAWSGDLVYSRAHHPTRIEKDGNYVGHDSLGF